MGSRTPSKRTADFDRLYELGEGFEPDALRARSVERVDAKALLRDDETPAEPVRFEITEGGTAYDFVGTTRVAGKLVSERFVDVLRGDGFSGWSTYPVELPGHEGYHGLAVRGRAGPIDNSLSEEITLPPPVPEGRSGPGWRGLYFAPETWDGSDLFVPSGSTFVFMTEGVAQALEREQITNIELSRLSEIERPAL